MNSIASTLGVSAEHLRSWPMLRSSPRQVKAYQLRHLRRVVRHASERVPYYAHRFAQSGVSVDRIQHLDDLHQLPISSKQDFQSSDIGHRLALGVGVQDCQLHETSGSTGQRMVIARTHAEELRLFGRRLRAHITSGLRPWHQRLMIGTSPRQLASHRLGIFPITAVDLSLSPNEILAEAERIRPDILKGPPGAFEKILQIAPERLAALSLNLVLTGAEQLSLGVRTRLENVCGCPVIDFYGAAECNLIAWQCGRCGLYHTCDDSVIVEVLNGDRPSDPGEEGDVVVTALHSYAMPFIRYRIGDRVTLPKQRPSCSNPFGVVESIQGRSIDYLHFENGIALSPYQVMGQLDNISGIRRYRVVQDSPRSVTVQYEPSQSEDSTLPPRVRLNLSQVFPADVVITPQRVDRIHTEPGEKRRFVRALDSHAK